MTGLEWVTGLLRLHGFLEKDAAAAAARALETVDLMDVANRKIGSYSKGMRQRVKLAQAFAHDPELLVLDEPLAGMDPLARRQIIRLIRNWGAARKTVVVSSHVLHEVEAMTSHVVLMNQGTVIADGDLHQLRELIDEHPHTVHVRCRQNRALARALLAFDDVIGLRLEEQVVIVQTSRPDAFYARLTGLAASGDVGDIDEISSPDDNLQAVFAYLVK